MQTDLNKLKTGDKVAFAERIEKIVSNICRGNGETRSVSFTDGTILDWDNSLWQLTEKAEIPACLHSGVPLTEMPDRIRFRRDGYAYTPGYFLKILKQDVALLEAVGVKEAIDKSLTEILDEN